MFLPVLAIDERRYTEPAAGTQPGLMESLRLTFANRPRVPPCR
jgi:hypothetical protein